MKKSSANPKKGFALQWLIWLLPLLAISITAWLYYQEHSERGPLIQITFLDAAGMEENKTPLRFRGINVGRVESMELSKDSNKIIVHARLRRDAEHLAVEGSQFSIVQPEVGLQGISGLDTLLGGPYIKIEQGKGEEKVEFEGLSRTPDPVGTEASVKYYLRATFADSIHEGDPVLFRGIQVGAVSGLQLDPQGQWVDVEINVRNKYVTLIRTNTVFWEKSGVSADISLFGAEIEIGSMQSLMKGGIAFATPNEPGKVANAGGRFPLHSKAPDNWKTWSPKL